jgi:hypothetical protein
MRRRDPNLNLDSQGGDKLPPPLRWPLTRLAGDRNSCAGTRRVSFA